MITAAPIKIAIPIKTKFLFFTPASSGKVPASMGEFSELESERLEELRDLITNELWEVAGFLEDSIGWESDEVSGLDWEESIGWESDDSNEPIKDSTMGILSSLGRYYTDDVRE